jgi:hypothetical protein
MDNDFINLVSLNLLVLNKEVLNGVDLLILDINTPSIDLTKAVSNKESSITVKCHRIWMLLLYEVFIIMLHFFEISHGCLMHT